MSTIQDKQGIWSMNKADSRYEKCRNITEEIYKRINITFQIKQLETAAQSDVSEQSDQIDSNELSNETDLFACDKTSISSSTEPERPKVEQPVKFINNNNNEEKPKKPLVVCKRPKKRFRKRVKKRQWSRRSESDASSDEALPLSRVAEAEARGARALPARPDLKPKTDPSEKSSKQEPVDQKAKPEIKEPIVVLTAPPDLSMVKNKVAILDPCTDRVVALDPSMVKEDKGRTLSLSMGKEEKVGMEMKCCSLCSLTFRGERGLRRHMTMSHIVNSSMLDRASKPA